MRENLDVGMTGELATQVMLLNEVFDKWMG
jgi:hypothetical protein